MKVERIIKLLKLFSLKAANFQAKLILSVVYFFIFPIFLIFNPKVKKTAEWGKWKLKSDFLGDLKKQY